MTTKVALVSGASSGIGNAVARALSSTGYVVFGTSRSIESGTVIDGIHFVRMDVNSEQQVASGVEYIMKQTGSLHVVVNNAGLGMVGPVECISDVEAREIFDTNVFGVLNVCRNTIQHMRESGGGYIINITSLAAQMGLPFRGIYSASKFAVEGFTESLSQEVSQFGIKVVIVEPGDFKTNINSSRKVASFVHESYKDQSTDTLKQIRDEVSRAPLPEAIGRCIVKIVNDPTPRLRYRVANLKHRFSLTLLKILPSRWFEYLIMKHYKLK